MSRFQSLLVVLVAVMTGKHATAQQSIPFVLRDLYVVPSDRTPSSSPGPMLATPNALYISAADLVNGRELWVSDGTDSGTRLVRDINPGLADSAPDSFCAFQGNLYFVATDGVHGRELWRTDGTANGTRIVADIEPGPNGSNPNHLVLVGNRLFFNAQASQSTSVFYVYDGSALSALTTEGACCLPGGACVQRVYEECVSGFSPGTWVGFGVACAVAPCLQPVALTCCLPNKVCVFTDSADCAARSGTMHPPNATCAVNCPDPATFTCCVPDGTCSVLSSAQCALASGTVVLLSSGCSPNPCSANVVACCAPSGVCSITSAGQCDTAGGTRMLQTSGCVPGPCSETPASCCRSGGQCTVMTSSQCLAAGGSRFFLASGCSPNPCSATAVACCLPGGQCQLRSSSQCIAAGATQLFLSTSCSPSPCGATPFPCCLPGGQCFLTALVLDCSSNGGSQGSGATCPSTCQSPIVPCCLLSGACTMLAANNCTANAGILRPLGTSCTPTPCTPLSNSASPLTPQQRPVYNINGQAFLLIHIEDQTSPAHYYQIWRTDGTQSGTALVATTPVSMSPRMQYGFPPFVTFGGKVIFLFDDGVNGLEPWTTDGTQANTRMLVDVNPGPGGAWASDPQFAESGGLLFFVANGPSPYAQLWRTDGTAAGTIQLSAFDGPSGVVRTLSPYAGGVAFTAIGPPFGRRSIWVSDGSPSGTRLAGPSLVQDGFTGDIQDPAEFNGILYFGARRANHQYELWRTDGTAAGTYQFYPHRPEDQSGGVPNATAWDNFDPHSLTVFNGRLFFGASNQPTVSSDDRELWATDGTFAGTQIVKNIATGSLTFSWVVPGFGQTVFFAAPSPQYGTEVFRSDGTVGGSQLVADLNPGIASSSPSGPCFSNGKLLFSANVPGAQQILVVSDGTPNGTSPLGTSTPGDGAGSSAQSLASLNGILYYLEATPATGLELWRSDGTLQGTGLAAELAAGPASGFQDNSSKIRVWNGSLYLFSPSGLYRYDGFPGTPVLLVPAMFNTAPSPGIPIPSALTFIGSDNRLWSTTGTPASTHRIVVADTPPYGVEQLCTAGGRIFFSAQDPTRGRELWISDGTDAGTSLILDAAPGTASSNPYNLVAVGSSVVYNSAAGWRISDGTPAGTRALAIAGFTDTIDGIYAFGVSALIRAHTPTAVRLWLYDGVNPPVNLTPAASTAFISDPVVAGQYAYFSRTSGSTYIGMFRTDGTVNGTVRVSPSDTAFAAANPLNVTAIGNDVYFALKANSIAKVYHTTFPDADWQLASGELVGFSDAAPTSFTAGAAGVFFLSFTPSSSRQVYVTDGTPLGARVVSPINSSIPYQHVSDIVSAGNLFYCRSGVDSIVRTDGTPGGTWPLQAYCPPGMLAKSAELNGLLYFAGHLLSGPIALWRSDESSIFGASQVSPLAPFNASMGRVGSRIFFDAETTSGSTTFGTEPCVTDGTASGTTRAADLCPGSGSSYPGPFTGLNGMAIFPAACNLGIELYRSDGTSLGTALLKDINPGSGDSSPRGMVVAGALAFFAADDGTHGRELWRTDGTTAGTFMVRDIYPGSVGSNPQWMTAAGDRIFFTAYTPDNGVELWTSDGTPTGTILLFEIITGPSSANISQVTRAGGRLYFLATVPPNGTALWSFDHVGGRGLYCPADYDRTGSLAAVDIFAFLSDWFALSPRSDFNGDGGTSVQDVFDFLNAWFAGC